MIDGKFFDSADILCYGAPFSVVFGSREIGKSYGQLRRALARRVRNHSGTLWLRPTAEDAETLAGSFGNGKWQKLWSVYGYDPERFHRISGNRIVYKDGNEWHPLIRYAGLSEWEKLRDNDDPEENFLYFDEFIMSPAKLKRYQGQPAANLLDAWVTLRRGKPKMPVLMMGNPELGVDWFLPAVGINDRQTPERVRVYQCPDNFRQEYGLDRVAVLWTRNPGGQSVGGAVSGTAGALPESLKKRRGGLERLYANIDLGYGLLSLWYGADCLIVDTVRGQGYTIKNFPDGERDTVVYSPQMKKQFVFLREYWRAGRVRFASAEAFKRFQMTAGRLI